MTWGNQQNSFELQGIEQRIATLEQELTALRNLRMHYLANRSFGGSLSQVGNYQTQHHCNESQSEYFGK